MALVSTTSTILGSFVNIKKGSKINSITVKLASAYNDVDNTPGRLVGLAYWVKDSTFNAQNMKINLNTPNMQYFTSASSKSVSNSQLVSVDYTRYVNPNDAHKKLTYFNTNLIPINTMEDVTFTFSGQNEINESEIFVALICTRGIIPGSYPDDVKYNWLAYDDKRSGILYSKGTMVDTNDELTPKSGRSLNIINIDVTLPSSETDGNLTNKPKPIFCKRLSYRTWSQPSSEHNVTGKMNDDHQLAVVDGGETCGYLYGTTNRNEIITKNEELSVDINNNKIKILPYIMNDKIYNNPDHFIDDFKIPMGRLSDVEYDRPSEGGLTLSGNTITQPRWCFKRSRIKFVIPGIQNAKYGTVIQYLVRTPINEKGIYSTKPKSKFYNITDTKKDISIVICPRDEGVLDNMPFEVVFSRQYASSKNRKIGYKSDDSIYKFHTYQKPIVNITYPKAIRNDSTWTEDNVERRNFKYAKIPTSNIYSNFDGEQAVRNKYVCDALNILFSTPKNDDSGIPMFVRFYVAEFKYGRDGCFGADEKNPIDTSVTTQDLFKSHVMSKYTSLDKILKGKTDASNCTAYLTNIFKNDGSPLLLSGRFNSKTLEEVGNKYHLWTFNTWDYVVNDEEDENKRKQLNLPLNDVRVFNAWEFLSNAHDENGQRLKKDGKPIPINIAKDIVGDHKDRPIKVDSYPDGDAKEVSYPVCKMLLFRAGYCYLIRIRMFHGAAAGAIGKTYGKINETCIGKDGTGYYNYENAFYSGAYPDNDNSKYGNDKPYDGWVGPDDGTGGLSLEDKNLNETFPGFSQVDYSLFEAVAPYSSKSNLITVHPTSPNISVNQCLSFNYRHLAKNIGGIDNVIFDGSKINTDGYFGRTFGGIHNTISRIMAMYTSCAETILSKYFKVRTENNAIFYNASKMGITNSCNESGNTYNVIEERLTLKIVPITERTLTNTGNVLFYTETLPKTYNIPLINKYDVNGINTWANKNSKENPNDPTAMVSWRFYTHNYDDDKVKEGDDIFKVKRGENVSYNGKIYDCGCYQYNEYRLQLNENVIKLNSSGNNVINPYKLNAYEHGTIWMWPERNIIYKTVDNKYSGSINEEPLGNVYRWQPVINAVQYDNGITKELKIQNVQDNITICNNNKTKQLNSIANGVISESSINSSGYIYDGSNDIDGNIQTAYFYQDITLQTTGSQIESIDVSNCDLATNSITKKNRFTINEFAGVITGDYEGSGFPVMQTLPSTAYKHYKYFDLTKTQKSYGNLYTRVPTSCDCENGIITTNTTNFGSLGRFKDIGLSGNNEIYSLDDNGINPFPLVRTTHYLYFKTHINVAFTLQADVKVKYTKSSTCRDELEGTGEDAHWVHYHGDVVESEVKTFYLNSNGTDVIDTIKESNNIITFANKNGIAEVYAEDNNGWGRCVSADDISAMNFKPDGGLYSKPILSSKGCVDASQISGGIEVPLLVRYTPLLQPKLISETINNKTTQPISKSVTIKEDRNYNASKILFNNGNEEIETKEVKLNINYPYIPEDETYTTRNVNGGLNNIYFENYHVDNDTDTPNDRNTSTTLTNMDFLGGYGICTAYTVLLVPSDPDLTDLSSKSYSGYNGYYLTNDEITKYFKNTDGHWNYFKQPNNYYKSGHIYGIRSKSQSNAGPVLVAYNAQLNINNKGEFLTNDNIINSGRNNQSISLNINNLRKCKVYYKNEWVDCDKFNEKDDVKNANIKLNKEYNKLNTGLIYDLVIVPIYSNETDTSYNWKKALAGTINSQSYGSNKDEEVKNVHFAGSNPLVLFNYLQVSANIIIPPIPPDDKPDPQPEEPKDIYKIHNTDGGIIFPNVDNEMFNQNNGTIKESPGFWLNNSFRLVLRLPSYRTKSTIVDDGDNVTIENASGGTLNSKNDDTANDFRFKDIQIHIGKIDELRSFGYPDNMETNLDKITNKDELAKLHIISYKDYYNDDYTFSKRLDDSKDDDKRELATAGALNPDDANYKNRFIVVNLSKVTIKDEDNNDVPIYTKYPEGFYIQFRVQSAYATNEENYSWSSWYGGSIDGGLHWWGPNGTNYYVPVRNYSEIFTEFRNYIKESYPGTYLSEKGFNDTFDKKYINTPLDNNPKNNQNIPYTALFGKGSLLSHAAINNNSKTKPKSSLKRSYYKQGLGNNINSNLVGSEQLRLPIDDCFTYELKKIGKNYEFELKKYNIQKNSDWPYKGNESYIANHDSNKNLLKNDNSRLWEMLYVDFIIRNMCKLYYKPNYNNVDEFWTKNNTSTSDNRNKRLKYHLSVPYENNEPIVLNDKTWSWDDTEYNLFKTNNSGTNLNNQNVINEDKSSKEEHVNGLRLKYDKNKGYWDLNKYYRKPITKNDFDELNQHLINLSNFISHEYLSGKTTTNSNLPVMINVLPIIANTLQFNKTRKAIIGSSLQLENASGHGCVNNLINQLTDINYIQRIWDNIKLFCQCYNDSEKEL